MVDGTARLLGLDGRPGSIAGSTLTMAAAFRLMRTVVGDVARVAADAVEDARAVAPDRAISLVAPSSLTIEGDELRLREVAANLLSNAVDHTPPGSPVEVRLFG